MRMQYRSSLGPYLYAFVAMINALIAFLGCLHLIPHDSKFCTVTLRGDEYYYVTQIAVATLRVLLSFFF